MIVINPGLVIGPLLQPTLNYSVGIVHELVKGNNPWNSRLYRFVDVRDVAYAHVKAFEVPSANGRYIVDGSILYSLEEIEKVFHEFFPDLRLADKDKDKGDYTLNYKICVDKVKGLGIEFTPVEVSLRDTIVSLKGKGFV